MTETRHNLSYLQNAKKTGQWQSLSLGNVIAMIVLVAGAILMVMPFLWMFTVSVQPGNQAFDLPPNWIPGELRTQNYVDLIESDVPFLRFGMNSLIVAVSVTVGQIVTGAMAGYAFAKLRFPGNNLLFILFLIGLMVPIQVTIIPIFIVMRTLNLTDTLWALILPSVTSAFATFLMRQFFRTLPDELIQAARIDGANQWTIFWRIAFPLARAPMAALGIITFTNTWNDYFMPLIFISSWENMTLPLGILSLRGAYGAGNVAIEMAGVSIAILPVLVVFLLAQRQIIEGMMAGSLKG